MTMVVAKLSISLSAELAGAIRTLAEKRGDDVSRLVETLLREHPLVRRSIEAQRVLPELKKGRDVDALLVMARQARRRWDDRVKRGQVKIRATRRR